MRKCMDKMLEMLTGRVQCIWVQTYEEDEFLKDLAELIRRNFKSLKLAKWSCVEGATPLPVAAGEKAKDPIPDSFDVASGLYQVIKSAQDSDGNELNCVWVLRDFHSLLKDAMPRRVIRDLKESEGYDSKDYNPIVVLSPYLQIDDELSKLFQIFEYELPTKEEIAEEVESSNAMLSSAAIKDNRFHPLSEEEVEKAVTACIGLTMKEIRQLLFQCARTKYTIDTDFLMQHKIEAIKKSGALDFKIPEHTMADIGGNEVLVEWLNKQKQLIHRKGKYASMVRPKGALFLGIPGCGKTAIAEALAGEMHVPFLSLNMSRVMSSLVGESEQKIEHALQIVKQSAPCVFLIDEIEKSIGGYSSSNQSDSGIVARIFKSVLEFTNDNEEGVFTIMTSNDVSQLPPELTRKGRLDGHWFFDLPHRAGREAILKIHFGRFDVELDDEAMETALEVTNQFTGAEIEGLVKDTIREALINCTDESNIIVTSEDIRRAAEYTTPVAVSSEAVITALRERCKGSFEFTEAPEVEEHDDVTAGFGNNPLYRNNLLDIED